MIFTKAFKSFLYACNGLKNVWREERNFRIEIVAALVVAFCVAYFHFSLTEGLFCLLAITTVLAAEIVNTALEDMCDKIQPELDPAIGKIKDLMAAFVLVSVTGAFGIGIAVFYHHFLYNF